MQIVCIPRRKINQEAEEISSFKIQIQFMLYLS